MNDVVWYFGLEPINARYTGQLSQRWIPDTFKDFDFRPVPGTAVDSTINQGVVLDACNRGIYAMAQASNFLKLISQGEVTRGQSLYVQDFWHPGLEAIYYALDLYGIPLKIYSMLHAQSVDEYDFTYDMRDWMRPIELGYAKKMEAIFVGSTIHRDQLRSAGIDTKIHVVSLPYGKEDTANIVPNANMKENQVIFTSRLDKEKNPYFLLEVIKQFLKENPAWTWLITTSGTEIKSNLSGVVNTFRKYAESESRFRIKENLTKSEYYNLLDSSKILFNSSLQDYVSWTSIEAHTFGTRFICPRFRSFYDFCSIAKMYEPFSVESAILHLNVAVKYETYGSIDRDLSGISDLGRKMVAYIIKNPDLKEINIWHELEYCKMLLS